ncbi:hypothetical protein Golax_010908 [Gossypium laxum]|uniref:RNase H type-1 domain-containing protein n=1 Tax=Gossypium laxum TaxID=34288 RepID=A0A7J8ZJE4_9ROSI|nr:hypothetical protein [Gossypium laxum]
MGIPPPHPEASVDRIIWGGSTTDGSVRLKDDSATAGGVVRNRNGEWIIGYNRFLGSCLMFEAELWRILDDLNTLIDRGLDNVMV